MTMVNAESERPSIKFYGPNEIPAVSRNRFSDLIPSKSLAVVSSFTLESGVTLTDVPVAYQTWGKLNDAADNAMVLCHALTGSSDVQDWWGPLLGPGKAFDPTRYFIFCANVLGSPYGTASPVTINPATGTHWGPEFPGTTIRDDIFLGKLLLDALGVRSVATVIGGSMGGMSCLEWVLCTPPGYVRSFVPIATTMCHSAWGISWGEAQRQSIWSDPDYKDGYYKLDEGPVRGLSAARMAALLTYRSRDSFETRFGRNEAVKSSERGGKRGSPGRSTKPVKDSWPTAATPGQFACAAHNDGITPRVTSTATTGDGTEASAQGTVAAGDGAVVPAPAASGTVTPTPPPIYSAQSYLRYQGDKFVNRFDANCYVHLSHKLDSHDITRGRFDGDPVKTLENVPKGSIVLAISSDGLFTMPELRELAESLPGGELIVVSSPDGHDGFLLEFQQINTHLLEFLHRQLPEIYAGEPLIEASSEGQDNFIPEKPSLFGESEGRVLNW